ncbi:MAG: hypothetical protein M1834_003042 [Cirrosporium novae-zelandiae]|nr:MAG: hypothetical protein M1834_003042 [Cirrosporium novae-zelandiae]
MEEKNSFDIKSPEPKSPPEVLEGEIKDTIPIDEGFRRDFTPRQIHVISLGSQLGAGYWVVTGKALANGGPGAVFLAYVLVCTGVTVVLQTLSEMTIAFPVSGNFVNFADRWVDPAAAFAVGFAEWLGWTATTSAEALVFNTLVNYWADGSVHEAVWLSVFVAACMCIFIMPNKWFAWFEYVVCILKIVAFFIIIVACFAMIGGAGPAGKVHNGETWRDYPAFANGFQGFGNAMLIAIWAMGDQVFTGIMAGESASPRFSMAHATKLVPLRVTVVFLLSVVVIGILVPQDEPRLFSGSSSSASPFVIALNDAGIQGLPDFVNVIVILGILSVAVESVYISSRILRAMSHQGLLPKFIARIDSKGRPRWSLAITGGIAIMLTYINLSNTGAIVFTWLSNVISSSFMLVWIIVSITSFRFRAAIKAQNDPLFTETYAYRCTLYPFPPTWLFLIGTLLLTSLIYTGLLPVGSDSVSVYSFFEYFIGVLLVLVGFVGFKFVYPRTKLRDPRTADLKTGRRTLSVEEIEMLDKYYRMPVWRRVGTYVKIW